MILKLYARLSDQPIIFSILTALAFFTLFLIGNMFALGGTIIYLIDGEYIFRAAAFSIVSIAALLRGVLPAVAFLHSALFEEIKVVAPHFLKRKISFSPRTVEIIAVGVGIALVLMLVPWVMFFSNLGPWRVVCVTIAFVAFLPVARHAPFRRGFAYFAKTVAVLVPISLGITWAESSKWSDKVSVKLREQDAPEEGWLVIKTPDGIVVFLGPDEYASFIPWDAITAIRPTKTGRLLSGSR